MRAYIRPLASGLSAHKNRLIARTHPAEKEPRSVGREDHSAKVALHRLHGLPNAKAHDVEEGHVDRLARTRPARAQAMPSPLLTRRRDPSHQRSTLDEPLGDNGSFQSLVTTTQRPEERICMVERRRHAKPLAQQRSGPRMRQPRLLSVGADGGGYASLVYQ